MAYIVDLTLIMQNLFWLAVIDRRAINRRLIKFAFKAYEESREKAQVHSDISDFVKQAGIFDRASRDNVLDKIVELIGRNRIESAEMRSLESRIGDVDFSGDDEAWDVETNV
jgi:tRNA C32,U32 (ribose-2'-O)-methylase TrmJ